MAPLAGAAVATPTGRRILIGVVLGGAMIAIILSLAIATMVGSLSQSDSSQGSSQPSANALADIPGDYLALYLQAGQRYGVDWAVLAAVGKIESDHGRGPAVGILTGVNFAGCCAGPMQFSIIGTGGGTWGAYGVDGNHDGNINVYDPADAIPAAAKYLKASGAPGDYHRALFTYGGSAEWYVSQVLAQAATYRGALQDAQVAIGNATVESVITAASALNALRLPYNYGGGHSTPAAPGPGTDGPFAGLDCSSSVSWVLQHAGIDVPTMTSTGFMSWGDPGPGSYVTLYANPDHIFMSIVVGGRKRYFGTSGFGHPEAGTGPAWFTRPVSAAYIAGFTQRHPPTM